MTGVGFSRRAPHDPADVPNADCSCGIYARHQPASGTNGQVAGVIEAWGKIEVGTNGFRAQRARLIALANPMKVRLYGQDPERVLTDDQAKALGDLYRVPVLPDTADLVATYPPGDVSALLGEPERPQCAGCEAAARGQYAIHVPTCPLERGKSIQRNHVHVSFAPGGMGQPGRTVDWTPAMPRGMSNADMAAAWQAIVRLMGQA